MKEFRNGKYINFKYAKGKTDIYGRIFHDYYEIYLLLGGNAEFTNNHMKQTIVPFQMVLIPPGEYHQFTINKDIHNYERCVINIYPEFLPSDILNSAFCGRELLTLSESNRITEHFKYLIKCLSTVEESDFSHILSAVATDIIFLIKNSFEAKKVINKNSDHISFALISYLDEHFTEQIDLNMLSNRFFCSVSSLCHVFKISFGISIKKYVIQKRVNAAKIALQRGEKPEEVCVKCGFCNYSTFYRDYKKYLGVSPSETYMQKNAHL